MRFLSKTADIVLRHGCIFRFLGARFHRVGGINPILDNHRCRVGRSLHRRMALFEENMIVILLS
jgi:hypothetical protein